MRILTANKELSYEETYALTMSPESNKMKEFVGSEIEVSAWAIYEDVDKSTGELHRVLSIQDPDGAVYGTNSDTFMDELVRMSELAGQFGKRVASIEILTGTSKKGRDFVTCKLARAEDSTEKVKYYDSEQ